MRQYAPLLRIGLLALPLLFVALAPLAQTRPEAKARPPAEKIVAGLSQNRVSITADFSGDEILIYGAVKRESAIPDSQMHVIITVEGPSGPVTVRKKERVAGLWINNDSVNLGAAPSFYAVATTGPLERILLPEENAQHAISIDQLVHLEAEEAAASRLAPDGGTLPPRPRALLLKESSYINAMIRVRAHEGRYRLLQNAVQLSEQTLFRADVTLPANLTEGLYRVRTFLLREGRVIDSQDRWIGVRKEGLERAIFNLAHENPLGYGLLSLVIAAFAGWAASAAFKLLRP